MPRENHKLTWAQDQNNRTEYLVGDNIRQENTINPIVICWKYQVTSHRNYDEFQTI